MGIAAVAVGWVQDARAVAGPGSGDAALPGRSVPRREGCPAPVRADGLHDGEVVGLAGVVPAHPVHAQWEHDTPPGRVVANQMR